MCFHQLHVLCACFVFGCAYCSAREDESLLLQQHPFLGSIFHKYGGPGGRLSHGGLLRLLHDLSPDCSRPPRQARIPDLNVDEGAEHSEPASNGQKEKNDSWNGTFLQLVEHLPQNLSLSYGGKCIPWEERERAATDFSPLHFLSLCPAILYELDATHLQLLHQHHSEDSPAANSPTLSVWLFATLAVVVISLCGLVSVAVVPLIQRSLYQSLLQFLIGMAVGSLSGDALLHLVPHAMTGLGHDEHQGEQHARQETYIWAGLVALGGVFTFYLAERCRATPCSTSCPT